MTRRFAARPLAAALVLSLGVPACAQYAPGFSPSERQQGQQANQEIVQQYGGAMSGPLAAYVERVGRRIAAKSDPRARPEDFTVTLLNSTVPNAFATPGGYVYVTRGLLAIMNNEAELATVMGHEVGHVVARHSTSRNQRAGIAGILAGIAGAVTGSDALGGLLNLGANAYVAGFSRDQERQADDLGQRYAVAAGYDPYAISSMLSALGRATAQQGQAQQRGLASIFSTHPVTSERVQRTAQQAQRFNVRPGQLALNRDPFLNSISGMVYGDDPTQGIVDGTAFRHAPLNLAFDAPQGFTLNNAADNVSGRRQDGSNFVFAGAPANLGLEGAVRQTWAAALNGQVPNAPAQQYTINGVQTMISSTRLQTNGGPADVTVAAYRWSPQTIFVIRTVAPAGRGNDLVPLINSVRPLSAADRAAATRVRRIQVVPVRAGETVQSLASRMAYNDRQVERFAALNNIDASRPLAPGSRVKLIVWGQ